MLHIESHCCKLFAVRSLMRTEHVALQKFVSNISDYLNAFVSRREQLRSLVAVYTENINVMASPAFDYVDIVTMIDARCAVVNAQRCEVYQLVMYVKALQLISLDSR